jgi:DNA-directed RNA polymerase specialized sigma24 family protein
MSEPAASIISSRKLEDLLGDPAFPKVIDLVSKEVMRAWSVSRTMARSFVLSAIGEPNTLASIHDAWVLAKQSGGSLGLAKLIIRRRVIDLLRKDARQANHYSLAVTVDAIETEKTLGAFHDHVQRNPQAQLELREVIQMVRSALACFATQGGVQQRQAQLLRRYALDDASYSELSVELACSETALRVRVHKAMLALRKHIQKCHPELEGFLQTRASHVTVTQADGLGVRGS